MTSQETFDIDIEHYNVKGTYSQVVSDASTTYHDGSIRHLEETHIEDIVIDTITDLCDTKEVELTKEEHEELLDEIEERIYESF